MGLLIATMRKRYLQRMKSNADYKLTLISLAMAAAQQAISKLMDVGTDYDSESKIAKRIKEREYKFKIYEDKLKRQQEQIKEQVQTYDVEIKSCDDMIKENIQGFFSYK